MLNWILIHEFLNAYHFKPKSSLFNVHVIWLKFMILLTCSLVECLGVRSWCYYSLNKTLSSVVAMLKCNFFFEFDFTNWHSQIPITCLFCVFVCNDYHKLVTIDCHELVAINCRCWLMHRLSSSIVDLCIDYRHRLVHLATQQQPISAHWAYIHIHWIIFVFCMCI
jgi:hypothetical protein